MSNQAFETPQDALAHFGVKGMKWGVVNDDETKGENARHQKRLEAASKLSQAADDKEQLSKELSELGIEHPKMRELYGKAFEKPDVVFKAVYGQSKESAVKNQINLLDQQVKKARKDADAKANGKMTDGQKKLLVGAILGTAIIAAGVVAYRYDAHLEKVTGPGDKISATRFMKRYMERASDEAFSKPLTLSSLHGRDYVVPKGTEFRRITAFKDELLSNRLYATHLSADNDKYAGLYGPMLRMRTGQQQLWISKMVMGEEIKSPSPRKRVELLSDLIATGSKIPRTYDENDPHMMRALRQYKAFSRDLVGDSKAAAAYFELVRKAGYNALIDDNDAGQLSEAPMILLNASKTVVSRTFEELTNERARQSRNNLLEILDVKHSDSEEEDVTEMMEHSGVKGMKWGVRKDAGHEGERAKTKTIAKLDKKYEKSFSGQAGYLKVHNAVAGEMNKRLDAMNARHPGDISKPGKAQDAYFKDYEKVVEESVKAATASFGTNASGTGRVKVSRVGEGEDAWWSASWEEIKHAEGDTIMFKIVPKFDKTGHIIDQTLSLVEEDDEMEHFDALNGYDDFFDFVDEESLAHFGVKGMKWGRRKASDQPSRRERRARNKQLNLESARSDAAKAIEFSKTQKNSIDAARTRVYSGANKQRLKDAKLQYRKDKTEIGTRAAKNALRAVKDDIHADYTKSQEYLPGEFTTDLLRAALGTDPYGVQRQAEIRRSLKYKG